MKKSILFIICMAVCLSLIGGAIAVSFYAATPKTGSITADSALILTIGGSDATGLELEPDSFKTYDIYAQIERSTSAASEKGELVISVTTTESKTLTGVTFGLYSDSGCTTKVADNEGLTVNGSGNLNITVSNIDANTHYYLKVSLGTVASAEDLANISGNINIALNRQA